jgi:hypothetical protein
MGREGTDTAMPVPTGLLSILEGPLGTDWNLSLAGIQRSHGSWVTSETVGVAMRMRVSSRP